MMVPKEVLRFVTLDRFAWVGAIILSPVLFILFYMAVGSGGSTAAIVGLFILNAIGIIWALQGCATRWLRQDRDAVNEYE